MSLPALTLLLGVSQFQPALATATLVLGTEQFWDCSCELGITLSSLIELLDGPFLDGVLPRRKAPVTGGRLELVYFEELNDVLLCMTLPRAF